MNFILVGLIFINLIVFYFSSAGNIVETITKRLNVMFLLMILISILLHIWNLT